MYIRKRCLRVEGESRRRRRAKYGARRYTLYSVNFLDGGVSVRERKRERERERECEFKER